MTRFGLARTLLLPVALLFLLPCIAYWFAGHATRTYDERVLAMVLSRIQTDRSLSGLEKEELRGQWSAFPLSSRCAAGQADAPGASAAIRELCRDYQHLAWVEQASELAIVLGLLALLVVGATAALGHRFASAQLFAFGFGWNALRILSAVIIFLHGGLAVVLSYGLTVLWTESYYPKLVLFAGILALLGVAVVFIALFRRVGAPLPVEGELLTGDDAPELWAHVRALAERVGTDPPVHIIGGIDDNFFVTEVPVQVGRDGPIVEGRTLFLSLSLIKVLSREESSAVLAHEMAHFAGGDTRLSRRLYPKLARFAAYVQMLRENPLTLPVMYLMVLYRAAFELGRAKHARARELAADETAARCVSREGVGQALVRVGAYSRFRRRVEHELFMRTRVHGEELAIGARLAREFIAFAASPAASQMLAESHQPHPFDSHPPLSERLAALDLRWSSDELRVVASRDTGEDSLLLAVRDGTARESRQWAAYERLFAATHAASLAYRYLPATPEEIAHVERYFPRVEHPYRRGGARIIVTYEGIDSTDGKVHVAFDLVKSMNVVQRFGRRYLDVSLITRGAPSICISKLVRGDAFIGDVQRYWSRHQMARAEPGPSPSPDPSPPPRLENLS